MQKQVHIYTKCTYIAHTKFLKHLKRIYTIYPQKVFFFFLNDGIICVIDIDCEKSITVPSVDNVHFVLIMLLSLIIINQNMSFEIIVLYRTFYHFLYLLLMTCMCQSIWGRGERGSSFDDTDRQDHTIFLCNLALFYI